MNQKDVQTNMDLNVLVMGGNQEDRNALTVLISDSLHQQGFTGVLRETVGETAPGSMSILDVLKDSRPHLFSESIHVTAAGVNQAFVVDDMETEGQNHMVAMIPTLQKATVDLDDQDDDNVLLMARLENTMSTADWVAEDPETEGHNSRMEVVLDSENDDLAA